MRAREYSVFLYRIFLVYFFCVIARGLFIYFSHDVIGNYSATDLFYYGLAFDNYAIMYINLLFMLLSLLPLWVSTHPKFQRMIFWAYFTPNTIAYTTNFIDMVYYPLSKSRLTSASFAVIEHEQNKTALFFAFLVDCWHMFVGFILLTALQVFLYKLVKVKPVKVERKVPYYAQPTIRFLGLGTLVVTAIRGDGFTSNTRPTDMLDMSRHVNIAAQADAMLNTPFCLAHSMGKNRGFKEYHLVDGVHIERDIKPIRQYSREVVQKPSMVLFISESFGREYWGYMNTKTHTPNLEGYTPFLGLLAHHSFMLDNTYCAGRRSIHGISSTLVGIPSLQVAYASSFYVKQPTQLLVPVAREVGYDTSFFHSAPNGSMGFLGFSSILGLDHYYGKTEYNNDADDDGHQRIWNESFFQYMCRTYSEKKQPFFGTIFTLSSCHPFQIPKRYEEKFPVGHLEIYKYIGYTNYALERFLECAKKQPWFESTTFTFVNDHPDQIYYDLYKGSVAGMGTAIMFYGANPNLMPTKMSSGIAQQVDIYPSLVDLMGYHKPFRSWGRSLFSNIADEIPRAFVSNAVIYQMMQGNYIYIIDENTRVNGIYRRGDGALKDNLLGKVDNAEIQKGIRDLKAFTQDYMDRIIDHKLDASGTSK